MSVKRYYLYAGLNVHAFAKAEAVLKFSEEDDGMWVKWEDYARLKAEVERLTAFTTRTIIPNEILQAQVERLTKAGDAMADRLMYQGYPLTIPQWNEAKDLHSRD
jgi:hypothetical protein